MRKLLLLFCFGLLTALVWGQSSTSGNITASGSTCTSTAICVTLPLSNAAGAAAVSVTGTWSATLQFEASSDNGVSFVAISGYPPNSTTGASNTTSSGTWRFAVSGLTQIRIRASAYSSGTAVVVINSSITAASLSNGGGGGGGSGTVTDFSSGDLSPLFTTSVATSSSTPALTFSLSSFSAHKFYGNATSSSGAPSASSIGTGDLPSAITDLANAFYANHGTTTTVLHGNAAGNQSFSAVSLSADVSGTLPVANGGTGQTSYTDGQLLIGNTTGNTLSKATLTAGANVTITNGHGTVTIAASGGSGSGCVPSGSANFVLVDDGSGACADSTVSISSGSISAPGSVSAGVGGSVAGEIGLGQGTAPSVLANGFSIFAPTGITTGYGWSAAAGENASAGLVHLGAASSHVSEMTVSAVSLTADVSGILPVANGGTGTASPALVQGTNVTITGSWPNQTINASGGGGTTTNALTMNNAGSGAASGSTFDGSAAKTLSYNTLGAAPAASPTFTGTVTMPAPTFNNVTGSTQCLHANTSGVVSGTGSDCGSGGSTPTVLYSASSAVISTSQGTPTQNHTYCWGPYQYAANIQYGQIGTYVQTASTGGGNTDFGYYTLPTPFTPGSSTATLNGHWGAKAGGALTGSQADAFGVSGGGTKTINAATWVLACYTSSDSGSWTILGITSADSVLLYSGQDVSSTTTGGVLNGTFTLPASPTTFVPAHNISTIFTP